MCANDGLIRLNKFVSWITEDLCNLFYYYFSNTRCDTPCDTRCNTPKLYSLETIRDSELAECLRDRSHNTIYMFLAKKKKKRLHNCTDSMDDRIQWYICRMLAEGLFRCEKSLGKIPVALFCCCLTKFI
jgi:hypothetical protein